MSRTQIFTTLIGCFLLTILFFHPIQAFNQDLGRHILIGNIIVSTKSIPDTNLLSYTYPTFPFINHHYFAEIVYSVANNLGGPTLLFLITLASILTTFLLLVLHHKTNTLSLLVATLFFLGILGDRIEIRPEIFSYLFLSIFITILFKNRGKPTKLLYLLPLVQIIWANTHIYFPLGLATIGLFFLDSLFSHRKNLLDKKLLGIAFITALCALVMMINPHGIKGALYPFSIMNSYGYSIEENQTPFLLMSLGMQKASLPYLFILQTIILLGLFIQRKKARLIDYLLLIFFTYLSFSAVRNIPLFGIALLPTSLYLFNQFFNRDVFTKKMSNVFAICLIVALLFQMYSFIHKNSFGLEVPETSKKAADFFISQHIKGPIFNNFDIGSYLAYRFYPNEKVFIDGRPEAYPADFIQKTYIPMQQDPSLFQKISDRYRFNAIFFTHTDQTPWGRAFVASIMQDKNFIPIYLDQDNLVLIKDVPSNKEIIKRYGLSQTTTPLSYSRAPSEEDLKKAANFYGIVNQQAGLIDTLTTLVNRYPNNCEYLRYLLPVLAQNQSPTMALYQDRYQTQCQ
ncbi:MAG: hypothetical protein KBC15_01930 [Candidatus Levybacteria bacterium]|nr:hypothetical protein [Candidatus Levybacteria bacterium]